MALPDAHRSRESYRALASGYDASCRFIGNVRRKTVALLELRPGDVVVDVASGTGLSFPLLLEAIGPSGHLIAIEHSPEMMALARKRVEAAGWRNVTLVESEVRAADLPEPFDAALLHYTHDVIQSPASLERLFGYAKPGARVAVAGVKYAPWWLAPVNLWVAWRTRRYLTTYSGLRGPWEPLRRYVPDLAVQGVQFETSYIGRGRVGAPVTRATCAPARPTHAHE